MPGGGAGRGDTEEQRARYEAVAAELLAWERMCRSGGLSESETRAMCAPLALAVRRARGGAGRRGAALLVALLVAMLVALLAAACGSEWVRWRAASLARLGMLRVLPLWDWRSLHRAACLLERPRPPRAAPSPPDLLHYSDCVSCETIKHIDRISDTSYDEVFNQHLIRGAPVIITDAYYDYWSSKADLNLTNLVLNDDRLGDSVPCRILTNIRLGKQPTDLHEIISRITNKNIQNWIVHFQNCDIRAVKSLRVLAPRPYFISPHIRPSHFNWILMSSKYDSPRYRPLELDVGLIVMTQLKGKTKMHLKPRAPCKEYCRTLNAEIKAGETLVLANSLWDFEYLPDKLGDNIAMVTETDWDEA